jgi:moderate conductance mechanosensitive channel
MTELPIQLQRLIAIALAFALAWIVHRLAPRVAARLVTLDRFAGHNQKLRAERRSTLRGLLANAISLLAIVVAILFALSRYVSAQTLVWVVGLFSAAFGLGARPLVNDFLAGISFIFEDTFDVGEKVELLGVEGVIEKVTLRITLIRAPSGELLVVPNGDIRVVRNFSRGRFSPVSVRLKIPAGELARALEVLPPLANEAMLTLPNMLEPWQIISETGAIGETAELTLITKAKFGHGAEMRPRLLAFVRECLTGAGIPLVD